MKEKSGCHLSFYVIFLILIVGLVSAPFVYGQDDDSSRQILKQGLLGAGTGAIAASASGGKAGQGALIGAGTGVIGSALLDSLTGPSPSQRRRVYQAAPPPAYDDEYYYEDMPEEYYEEPPQESTSSRVLKQGLLGAGTGAIAAGASGGDAGKGALIGAGTNVIGSALLDAISQPPAQQRRVYRRPPARRVKTQQVKVKDEDESAGVEGSRKKIIRKYDDTGKVISEEEIYY